MGHAAAGAAWSPAPGRVHHQVGNRDSLLEAIGKCTMQVQVMSKQAYVFPWGYISLDLEWTRYFLKITNFSSCFQVGPPHNQSLFPQARLMGLFGMAPPLHLTSMVHVTSLPWSHSQSGPEAGKRDFFLSNYVVSFLHAWHKNFLLLPSWPVGETPQCSDSLFYSNNGDIQT